MSTPNFNSTSNSAAFAAATAHRRVSKAKMPANDIIPGPIAPPGHPNFVHFTKKTFTSKKGGASAMVKATLAISDDGDGDGQKWKGDGSGGPQISVSITNKLVKGPKKEKAKLEAKMDKDKAEETTEAKEEDLMNDDDELMEVVTASKTVEVSEQQQHLTNSTASTTSLEKATEATEQKTFQQFYNPLLPTSADGLKVFFVDKVADSLEGNPQARALCEHLLALLKNSEE